MKVSFGKKILKRTPIIIKTTATMILINFKYSVSIIEIKRSFITLPIK